MRHFWEDVSGDEIVCHKCKAVVTRVPGVSVPLRRVSRRVYNGEVVRNLPPCLPKVDRDELATVGTKVYAEKHGYSRHVITGMAKRMGMSTNYRVWTDEEKSFVEWAWGNYSAEHTLKKLNEKCKRNRTLRQLLRLVSRMKLLGTHIPRGYESISAAARRHGMHRKTLLAILEQNKVRVYKANPSYQKGMRPSSHKYVEVERVDASITAFLEAESVYYAARRGRVSRQRLLRELAEMGFVPPPKSRRWRLPSHVMDEALARLAQKPPSAPAPKRQKPLDAA